VTTPDTGTTVRLRDGIGFCVVVFVILRLLTSVIGALSVTARPIPESATSGIEVPATPGWHNAIDGMRRWDALWFERIATNGYEEQGPDAAFFPGYPIAIRLVAAGTPFEEAGSAVLVSNVAFLGALIVLFALTSREYSKELARRTIVLLACFPASFFFLAPYSEALFLLLVALTFWWVRADRWADGALAAFGAALTRSVGVVLAPALLVEAWTSTRPRKTLRLAVAVAPLLALVAYAGYWLARSGDALWPVHAQAAWYRTLTFPPWTVVRGIWLGVAALAAPADIYRAADLLLTAVLLVPLAVRWRTIPLTYLTYALGSALAFSSYPSPDRPLLSDPRFLIVVFPAFWALAEMLDGRRFVLTGVCFVAAYIAMAIAFMNWAFVF
jgi:hypothetical protein